MKEHLKHLEESKLIKHYEIIKDSHNSFSLSGLGLGIEPLLRLCVYLRHIARWFATQTHVRNRKEPKLYYGYVYNLGILQGGLLLRLMSESESDPISTTVMCITYKIGILQGGLLPRPMSESERDPISTTVMCIT